MKNNRVNVEIPAKLCGVATKSDKTLALRFNTAIELDPEETAKLMGFAQNEGWLLFSMNEFQDKDIPKENAPISGKTPSKRLYDVLFVYWKENGLKEEFETFYKRKMEGIIKEVKNRLPDRF